MASIQVGQQNVEDWLNLIVNFGYNTIVIGDS